VFVLGEFLRVVTHARVLSPPSSGADAIAVLEELLSSPSVRLLMPQDRYWELLQQAITESGARGNIVYDAQIVALCRENGVSEILTEDRDFTRFRRLTIRRLSPT
jgi:toxin-antitoxin system PIN domain toxin